MAKYCSWFQEEPEFESCLNMAEPGSSRCSEHRPKKVRRRGDLTQKQREAVRRRDNYTCQECGEYGKEVDHIVELNEFRPEDRWMANLLNNLRTLCYNCHIKKTIKYMKPTSPMGSIFDTSTSARNRKRKRERRS